MIGGGGTAAATVALARGYLRFGRGRALVGAVLMALAALSEGVGLALLAPLLAILTGAGGGRLQRLSARGFDAIGVSGDGPRLAVVMALFVLAILLRALIVAARDRHLFDLQVDFVNARRQALLRLVTQSRWQEVATMRHARIIEALSGDVPRVSMAVQTLQTIALTVAMLAAQVVLVALLAPRLALAAAVALVVAALLSMPLTRRAYSIGEAGNQRGLRLIDITAQLLGGLKLALAQNLAGSFVAEFDDTLTRLKDEQRDYDQRRVRAQSMVTISIAAALAGLVLVGHAWGMPPAILLASLAILSRMAGPAISLLRSIRVLAQALPSYGSLVSLEAQLARAAPPAAASGPAPDFRTGSIRFDGVVHCYAAGAALSIPELEIAPGSVVGLAGPSGVGKTTFADLLSGLLVPTGGSITVGGVVLDDAPQAAWRDRIAYVAQDSYLFHDTIRRNLSWGNAAVTDEAIWAALVKVEAAALVEGIDGGLDALVAERGIRLSGGERQRLALARALLRAPDLLILDEATNAIDIAIENAIYRRLVTAKPRMTMVLVSHRPELLRFCDQVIDIDATGLASVRA